MSNPMVPPFQLLGPSNGPFPGTVCLPQVPLPTNWTMNPGDNATLQVVEIAAHGAALFSCVDITFAEPGDPRIPKVNETNCYNSSELGFASIYSITTTPIGSAAYQATSAAPPSILGLLLGPSSWAAWLGYLPLFSGAGFFII
jgi:hypothetical protein